jgi:hypothetical protein
MNSTVAGYMKSLRNTTENAGRDVNDADFHFFQCKLTAYIKSYKSLFFFAINTLEFSSQEQVRRF